jgi:hypothetical protein
MGFDHIILYFLWVLIILYYLKGEVGLITFDIDASGAKSLSTYIEELDWEEQVGLKLYYTIYGF